MRKAIEWVLKNRTGYQVAKDIGVNERTISRYQTKESPIENMSFGTAEKIHAFYKKEMEEMTNEMKTLNYTGMEYLEDRQVSVGFEINNFENVLNAYENMKYSDTDFESRPNEEELTDELANDLGIHLEEAIEDDAEKITIGYKNKDTNENDFMSFEYTIKEESKTDIVVEVTFSKEEEWSEGV